MCFDQGRRDIIQGGKYLVTVSVCSPQGVERASIMLLTKEQLLADDDVMLKVMRSNSLKSMLQDAASKVQEEHKQIAFAAGLGRRR